MHPQNLAVWCLPLFFMTQFKSTQTGLVLFFGAFHKQHWHNQHNQKLSP